MPGNPLTTQITYGGQPMASPEMMGVLLQIYGYDPFAAQHVGPGGEERAYRYGPLAGIPPAFVENVVRMQLSQGLDVLQQDPAALTAKVQDFWVNPNFASVRTQFALAQNQTNAGSAIVADLKGAANASGQSAILPFQPGNISGYHYMSPDPDYGPGGYHPGIDYGLAMNTPIVAPFAGTASVQDEGNRNLGKSVTFTFGNGWKLVFGHLNAFAVNNGIVRPGQLLGYSGSTGNSSGPHLHFEVRDRRGVAHDPAMFLKDLASGMSIGQLVAQYGTGIEGQPLTPEEQRMAMLGLFDPALERLYAPVRSAYASYFGKEPDDQTLMNILDHGHDMASWNDYIRQLPSHIGGIAIGPYHDVRTLADQISTKIYGHDSNDQIIKDLFDRGLTSPAGVQYMYDQLPFKPGKDVSPITYNAIYKSASEYTQGVWNQEPHPVDLQSMWHAAGAPKDTTASQANVTAGAA